MTGWPSELELAIDSNVFHHMWTKDDNFNRDGHIGRLLKWSPVTEAHAMGYETTLHLIDVKIKGDSISLLKQVLKNKKGKGLTAIQFFLKQAVLDDAGFLLFKPSKDYGSPYSPNEDNGTVPALFGKWYEAEQIAQWLKQHSEKGGRLIQHSCEGDGGAWGWEFDGRGKMRELSLCPIGKWG